MLQGPISVFSAQNEWTIPRTIGLTKDDENGFGFTIMGDNPSRVVEVEADSSAQVKSHSYDTIIRSLELCAHEQLCLV